MPKVIDRRSELTCNRDVRTGIRYGIIGVHDVDPDELNRVYQDGEDMDWKGHVVDVKCALDAAFTEIMPGNAKGVTVQKFRRQVLHKKLALYFSDYKSKNDGYSDLESVVGQVIIIMQETGAWELPSITDQVKIAYAEIADTVADVYEGGSDGASCMVYHDDEYDLSTDAYADLWVLKSPFFTYAQHCSPCAPGAVSLSEPLGVDAAALRISPKARNQFSDNRGYCLGHEWFMEKKAPYPVFSVATGKQVIAIKTHPVCENCKGTGRDLVSRLAQVRGTSEMAVINAIIDGNINAEEFEMGTPYHPTSFKCLYCKGTGRVEEVEYAEV